MTTTTTGAAGSGARSTAAVEDLVPAGPLGAFLADVVGDERPADRTGSRPGSPRVTRLGEGRSNLTFLVRWGGRDLVLRRPPRGDLPATAHDMLREHRVLTALADTPVRAPRPVAACADPAVIGVPFHVMEAVDGVVVREAPPPAYGPADRAAVGEEMIDALAEVHAVDVEAVGLGDLGRAEGYTARQVDRWTRQWSVMATRDLPDVDAVRDWLAASVPTPPAGSPRRAAALVHGDYKLDNVVLSPEPPARLRAVLDWEMATLGDPLADVGYLMLFWAEPGDEPLVGLAGPTALPGFATRAALLERYEARTGLPVTDLTFYRTLALWKLAILCEGLYKRYLAGKADGDWYAVLEHAVPRMAARARRWCGA